jgi:ATP-dependent DNA ligase
LPLRERRAELQQVVENDEYEGFVAKDEASAYKGGRTLSWLKVRQRDYRAYGISFNA